jgi:hypothetical protein
LKDLDRRPNQSEQEYQLRLALRSTETPKKWQNGEGGGVIQPVVIEAYIESEFHKTWPGNSASERLRGAAAELRSSSYREDTHVWFQRRRLFDNGDGPLLLRHNHPPRQGTAISSSADINQPIHATG